MFNAIINNLYTVGLKYTLEKKPEHIFELDDDGRVLSFNGEGNVRERDGAGGSLLTQLLHIIINRRSVKQSKFFRAELTPGFVSQSISQSCKGKL